MEDRVQDILLHSATKETTRGCQRQAKRYGLANNLRHGPRDHETKVGMAGLHSNMKTRRAGPIRSICTFSVGHSRADVTRKEGETYTWE